jgi:hypothetical protein
MGTGVDLSLKKLFLFFVSPKHTIDEYATHTPPATATHFLKSSPNISVESGVSVVKSHLFEVLILKNNAYQTSYNIGVQEFQESRRD